MQDPTKVGQNLQYVQRFQSFKVDYPALKSVFDGAPYNEQGFVDSHYLVQLPGPDGQMHSFFAVETRIMADALKANCSSKVYRLRGIDDPLAVGFMDTGVNGFHGYVRSPQGDYVTEPVAIGNTSEYMVYYRRENWMPRGMFSCNTVDPIFKSTPTFRALAANFGGNLKTSRLAMNATVEYSAVFGGTLPGASAAVVTTVNRVSGVYESEVAVKYVLVRNNPYLTEPDGFSNNNGGTMLGENQTNCDTNVGDAGYDIGHVFSTGGGGVAGLGVAGISGQKAKGVTGLPNPQGDAFDIDYVAHEMGHQWGGSHTFNSTAGACNGNRSANAAYEVGSGITIQAYAGICAPEDLAPHSDPFFHAFSLDQIWTHRNNTGSSGANTPNGNIAPVVNAGADVTIPTGTPYKLLGSATDGNSDPLMYCWEQMDLGTATQNPNDISTGPLVRFLPPTVNKFRVVPTLSTVLAGGSDVWEKISMTNRTMNWRLTVRDNRTGGGAIGTDNRVVTVAGAPFVLTSPNGGQDFPGNASVPVTWTVGGGSVSPKVNILLSTTGGTNYGGAGLYTLANGVNNTGSANVTMPNIDATNCRLIIEASTSIFFDVSNANFKIHKVVVGNVGLLSVGLAPNVIVGGTPVIGSVFLSRLADADTTVTLSDNSALLGTPASVVVPMGSDSAYFNLTSNPVNATANIKVTAKLGASIQTQMIQLNPAPPISALTLDLNVLYGGQSTDGTVTLANAANGYATAYFKSNKSAIKPDAKAFISTGTTTTRFHVDTVAVTGDTLATITAKVGNQSRTVTLTVKKMPVLASIAVVPTSIKGGLNATGTVTLTKPSIDSLAVLTEANSIRVTVPTQVNVLNGNAAANFTVKTYSVIANTLVTITGTFNGTVKTCTLTLTP